jgi:ATP-binding cassette subfamily B protein
MILGFMLMLAQRAEASAGRIFEILDHTPELRERMGAVDLVDPMGDVEFDDVTFSYTDEGAPVLHHLQLRLRPGETVALVGRTGCGKSTVARLLPRFYDVTSGAVRMDGNDVRDLTFESLRAAVGLVLDEPFLFSESIAANIAYGRPDAPRAEIVAAARTAGAHEFIEKLPNGYDTVIGERGYTLSGGQRQRIAIARTLLVNPRILILDDATSSIDVQVELEIHDALRRLMQGRTTLIIAHRLSTISLADRVMLMENGRITAEGNHAELMRTVPAYAEVLARGEEEWTAAHTPAEVT